MAPSDDDKSPSWPPEDGLEGEETTLDLVAIGPLIPEDPPLIHPSHPDLPSVIVDPSAHEPVPAAPPPRRRLGRSRRSAAEILAVAGDTEPVRALLEIAADEHEPLKQEVHAALVQLTSQDLGLDRARWLRWWRDNRGRDRVDWLIDALLQDDGGLRLKAGARLNRVSGESYSFEGLEERGVREACWREWRDWWAAKRWPADEEGW